MSAADTIIVADRVHTLDPAGTRAEGVAAAVAVKDGLIVAVGGAAEVTAQWRGAATEVQHLPGATLAPGLTDGHMHPVFGAGSFRGVDLSGCRTVADLRAALAAAVAGTGRGEWISGFGLDHNTFQGAPITNAVIDEVLDGIPALLVLYDGHSALASSAALRAVGIEGPRTFASRSQIVCGPDGRPTGHLLEDGAIRLVRDLMPVADLQERRAQVLDLLHSMAATGLTGGHVMDCEGDALELIAGIEELPLRLRIAPWAMPGDIDAQIDHLLALRGTGGPRWSVDAVKFFIDGTVEGGTAWLETADCHGRSTDSFWHDPAHYTRAVQRLDAAGMQAVTHAIGDAGVRHALDALDPSIGPGGPAGPGAPSVRHRIEHIETLPYDQIKRFAHLDVAASMQPTHTAYTRADHSDDWSTRLGAERAGRAWCCRDLRDTGATLVLGSDWPIAHFDPRQVLATAQLRRLPGTDSRPVGPEQALTALMALEGMTTHAAHATGQGHHAGRIAPGHRADLTAFGLDPLTAPPDELAEAPIRLTMVDGVTTHRG
ncbi:amidohydrolase [Streptacidiphilus sp. N1-12]|uniref:Amidohydrolase n=2 Tax=Streptacidiphilus alkalitolerans TaxID=3342712 RepID=A0ABV6WFC8_9ACTN